MRPLLLVLVALLLPVRAHAQDTLEVTLPEVQVQAARATETEASAPFAVSVLHRSPTAAALEPGLSLERVLRKIPGLVLDERGHDALGERLIIRGMGWHAPFGVRGVQVILDGIPLTMPDGQAVLDIVEPALIRRAEVIRGPASLFWGNAAGGVLFLSTGMDVPDSLSLQARALTGDHDLRQLLGTVSVPVGSHRVSVYASHRERDGFRNHSRSRITRGGIQARLDLAPTTHLHMVGAAAGQDVQHPGALTLSEWEADPHQANPRFLQTRSGKESVQIQGGATLYHQMHVGLLSATVYGITRSLDNPLPFAYIGLHRTAGGTRLSLQQQSERVGWSVGFDTGWQRDDRTNHPNQDGRPGDDVLLDQRETVRSAAAFGYLRYAVGEDLSVTAGSRLDAFRLASDDRLLENGDQSGRRTFSAWSPSVGLSYDLGPAMLFAGYGTAFETPTTTELVNRPDGEGGFNPELNPQRTRGVELGIRGWWTSLRLYADATVFRLRLKDRLLPFQSDEGRTFFRNAGANTHTGFELHIQWHPRPGLSLVTAYTRNHFVFDDTAVDGHRIPGVPAHHLFAEARAIHAGFWVQTTLEYTGDTFADNANTVTRDDYTLVDLNLGYTDWRVAGVAVQPFVGVSNVLGTVYAGSVVVNASGERFFEPSPGRTIQAGLHVRLP